MFIPSLGPADWTSEVPENKNKKQKIVGPNKTLKLIDKPVTVNTYGCVRGGLEVFSVKPFDQPASSQ